MRIRRICTTSPPSISGEAASSGSRWPDRRSWDRSRSSTSATGGARCERCSSMNPIVERRIGVARRLLDRCWSMPAAIGSAKSSWERRRSFAPLTVSTRNLASTRRGARLPERFPRMNVDTRFYRLWLGPLVGDPRSWRRPARLVFPLWRSRCQAGATPEPAPRRDGLAEDRHRPEPAKRKNSEECGAVKQRRPRDDPGIVCCFRLMHDFSVISRAIGSIRIGCGARGRVCISLASRSDLGKQVGVVARTA